MTAVWSMFNYVFGIHVRLMQSGRDLAAAAVVRTVRSSVCHGCRMGHVIRYVFSGHVNLLPSSHSLVAAAVARTVHWRGGRDFSLGHVFLDVFRRHVGLLPYGHKLATKQWREFAGVKGVTAVWSMYD